MADYSNSLFNSKTGKSVIVAFDHGIAGNIYNQNPRTLAEKFIAARPDGVLMSPPLIHLCSDLFDKYPDVVPIATLATVNRTPTFAGPMQIFDFDFAVEMGARAIKNLLKNPKGRVPRARHVGECEFLNAVLWQTVGFNEVIAFRSSEARPEKCHGLCPWVST